MMGRWECSRNGSFPPEIPGLKTGLMMGNLCFALLLVGVVLFTIFAAPYEPDGALFPPTTKTAPFMSSTSNHSLGLDPTLEETGEDFSKPNQTTLSSFFPDITELEASDSGESCSGPIDCSEPEVFQLMMKKAIEKFKDRHFYRFGKPVRGSNDSSCDMAWWYRPKKGGSSSSSSQKDYRRFMIHRNENCTYEVTVTGEFHSGVNARKKKKMARSVPVDTLRVVKPGRPFADSKYLVYIGGGDRCKNMDHYLRSFSCALGEALYLNRTLVVDTSICLNSMHTSSGVDEEGNDFRFYFDFEHLKETASVIEQNQFWEEWHRWETNEKKKRSLKLHLVEGFRITPMMLTGVEDALIMRKFGSAESDSFWYRVCEGKTASIIRRPCNRIRKAKSLMDIVSAIVARLNSDYDAVRIDRRGKTKNTAFRFELHSETALASLLHKIDPGRTVYIATDVSDSSFFPPLKKSYDIHSLDEFKDLWDENSVWYHETRKFNRGVPVEFDGYMKESINTEVFLRGKKQIQA